MNLKQLLTEYRGYELRCVGKQIPLSFRQWVHNEYDMPNLTMEGLIEALTHCEKVFQSMADRGAYPKELTPNEEEFLGKQGWVFIEQLIKESK